MSLKILSLYIALVCVIINGVLCVDYKQALTNSLLYFEAQRSGKLPSDQRVSWRGDSALTDGKDSGVDLAGGYYDAGDNVKFGFPMGYTTTMLAWSVVEYRSQLEAKNELQNALAAIKWGTDYIIKAHPEPNVFYAGVGEGHADHDCWERPEDMDTPRTVYKIDESHPGSDLAAEAAAALAAASIAFSGSGGDYSSTLLTHAKQLFDFAKDHQGKYSDSFPSVNEFYSSSGYQDELLWAAAWLLRATDGEDESYKEFLSGEDSGGTRTMFSWDDKYVGAQVLVAKLILDGKDEEMGDFKDHAEEFICNCVQKGNNNIFRTPGGMLWFNEWNNLQYTTSASLIMTVYGDYLKAVGQALKCPSSLTNPDELLAFARSQVDYILGGNSNSMSYMVGFGDKYPQKVHHRGASIVSIKEDPTPVGCKEGFDKWFYQGAPNPNVLVGAIVGGPDKSDSYTDDRGNFKMAEAATANTAPLIGVLARIA